MRLTVLVSFLVVSAIEPVVAQNAYVRLGRQAYVDGDFKRAIKQLEKAYLIDSTDATSLWMLGYSYYHSNNYPKAVASFTKELTINPTDAYAYYYRAQAKSCLGRDVMMSSTDREKYLYEAIFDYTKAIEINPNDPKTSSFYQNRGIAYLDYAKFKLDPASHSYYDRARGIKSLRASIDDMQRILNDNSGRADIATILDQAKEKLASVVGHH